MDFQRFANAYPAKLIGEPADEIYISGLADDSERQLIVKYGGASFEEGLYRVMNGRSSGFWRDCLDLAYPASKGRVSPFAFDWLGRVFATDTGRIEKGSPGVVMFEPGTGQVLEIPANLMDFHNDELVEYKDAALASNFFSEWLAKGGEQPAFDQCVGYKTPLFLGGVDATDNLELIDIQVYWWTSAQLIARLKRG